MNEINNDMLTQRIEQAISHHNKVVDSILQFNIHEIEKLCLHTTERLSAGGKIMFLGNGGSAADSQHLAAEFIGRFKAERIPLPALALTTDTSVITAVANDYSYDDVFVRQVAALCKPTDVVIGISTSGNSRNIIAAIEEARRKNAFTVGLLGRDGGKLAPLVDLSIVIHAEETDRIQECHILIGHILCHVCDEYFTSNY